MCKCLRLVFVSFSARNIYYSSTWTAQRVDDLIYWCDRMRKNRTVVRLIQFLWKSKTPYILRRKLSNDQRSLMLQSTYGLSEEKCVTIVIKKSCILMNVDYISNFTIGSASFSLKCTSNIVGLGIARKRVYLYLHCVFDYFHI